MYKLDITNFLLSDKDREIFIGGDIFIKEHITDNIIFLYNKHSYYHQQLGESMKDFEFSGIYDKENGIVYELKYLFTTSFKQLKFREINDEIKNILSEKITKYAKENINKDELVIDENNSFKVDVINDYFNDVKPEKVEFEYEHYGNFNDANIMRYILYREKFIEDQFNIDICSSLAIIKIQLKEKLEKNMQLEKLYREHTLWEINKNIYKALNKDEFKKAKTINITIEYDEDCITFKFDKDWFNGELPRRLNFYYAGKAWEKVESFLRQHKPREIYGRYSDECDFKNITKITYGRKVIYEREEQ